MELILHKNCLTSASAKLLTDMRKEMYGKSFFKKKRDTQRSSVDVFVFLCGLLNKGHKESSLILIQQDKQNPVIVMFGNVNQSTT